jgi:hypothetical protein
MSLWLTNWRLDPWRWSPERLVARPDFESGLDEGHEGLVLTEGENGLQEEDLRVAKLGVNLCFGPKKWPVLLLRCQKSFIYRTACLLFWVVNRKLSNTQCPSFNMTEHNKSKNRYSIYTKRLRKGLRWLLWWINLQWLILVKLFLKKWKKIAKNH